MPIRPFLMSLPLLLLPMVALLMAYPDGPDPQLTGGFGEQNCTRCHKGQALNAGRAVGGTFRIEGVPRNYTPGSRYPLKVVIGQPGQSVWGFQLSVRRAEGGQQGGRLESLDGNTSVQSDDGIQYISQTTQGNRRGLLHGPVEFEFAWVAPETDQGLLIFNAAGNAGNNSDDESGDSIFSAGEYSLGAQPLEAVPVITASKPEAPRRRRNVETPILVQIPTPVDRKKGDFEVQIQHRFQGSIDSGLGRAFGIDRGANINLGLGYSITDRLSAGVTRERFGRIVTFNGTYELHHDERSFWSMDFHGGVEAPENFQEHYSPFLQLATAWDYRNVRFHVTPTMIFNSRSDAGVERRPDDFVNPGDNHTFSVGFGADVALSPSFSLIGEVIPRLAGFGGDRRVDDPTYAAGVKIRSRGHVFSIFVSKSIDFTPAVYGLNANRGNDDVSLGFNIYRRIR